MSEVHTPYELRFIAPKNRFEGNFEDKRPEQPWYSMIRESLGVGDTIYEVFAFEPEHAGNPDGPTEVKIADVVLKSKLHTSIWADNSLYFRHKHVHPDRKYWPVSLRTFDNKDGFLLRRSEFGFAANEDVPDPNYWPNDPVEAKKTYIDQMEKYNCPFAWLLGMY